MGERHHGKRSAWTVLPSAEGDDIVLPDVSPEDFAASMAEARAAAAQLAHERLAEMANRQREQDAFDLDLLRDRIVEAMDEAQQQAGESTSFYDYADAAIAAMTEPSPDVSDDRPDRS